MEAKLLGQFVTLHFHQVPVRYGRTCRHVQRRSMPEFEALERREALGPLLQVAARHDPALLQLHAVLQPWGQLVGWQGQKLPAQVQNLLLAPAIGALANLAGPNAAQERRDAMTDQRYSP